MPNPSDKTRNFIYNSDEVIYGEHKDLMFYICTHDIITKNNSEIIEKYNIDRALDEYKKRKEIYRKLQDDDVIKLSEYDENRQENITEVKVKKLKPGTYLSLHFPMWQEDKYSLVMEYAALLGSAFDFEYHKALNVKDQFQYIDPTNDPNAEVPLDLQYEKTINPDGSYYFTFKNGVIERYKDNKLQSVEYPEDKIIFSYHLGKLRCSVFLDTFLFQNYSLRLKIK